MARSVLAITLDVSINGVGDYVVVPKVSVQLEIRLGTGQRVTESMVEKNMVHPFLPACYTVMSVESCFTKATSVGGWWPNMAEMGQTVQNPFSVVGIRKMLETI